MWWFRSDTGQFCRNMVTNNGVQWLRISIALAWRCPFAFWCWLGPLRLLGIDASCPLVLKIDAVIIRMLSITAAHASAGDWLSIAFHPLSCLFLRWPTTAPIQKLLILYLRSERMDAPYRLIDDVKSTRKMIGSCWQRVYLFLGQISIEWFQDSIWWSLLVLNHGYQIFFCAIWIVAISMQ